MDLLFNLWVFDNRWVFKLNPPLSTATLVFPILYNVVCLTVIIMEKLTYLCHKPYFLVDTMILIGLISLMDLFMIILVKMKVSDQIKTVRENQDNIS